ncbi:helix-turn-helix transcriptional regulator [Prescottella equi]|nr:helix-turn-helix transcriptional regulator [Prescottella equi]
MPTELSDASIGKLVVELREARGLNQGQLSDQLRQNGLNWSQGTLSKVEAGARPVRLTEAPILALTLRTSVASLVGEDQPKAAQPMPTLLQHEVLDMQERLVDSLDLLHRSRELQAKAVGLVNGSWDTTTKVLDFLTQDQRDGS